MSPLSQTVTLPSFKGVLSEWLTAALAAAESAEKLTVFGEWFANRAMFDNRMHERDSGGYSTGARVNGSYHEGHPTRKILWQGSAEERSKGMFFDERVADDATEYTAVRPWSESIPLREGLSLPNNGDTTLPSGTHTISAPSEMAYQQFVGALGIGPLARVFVVDGRQGEAGVYFFPMAWGEQKDMYFAVEIGARYGDMSYFFFQGDPAARCAVRPRRPRAHEVSAFFASRESGEVWGAKECPSLIPITYQLVGESPWVDPQKIELRDVLRANQSLKSLSDSTGQAPYICGGG